MDLKPQTFFIGVVDFFSVWLPGAILTWFLKIMFYDPGTEKILGIPDNEAIRVIFFLLVTYIIGSILAGLSSLLDSFYDKNLRQVFKTKDKDHFDLEVKTATAIRNTFVNTEEWIVKHHESGQLSSDQVKKLYIKGYRYIINTYKWSQHYLLFNNPEALADVKRLEADSKFFRSLILTFFIISAVLFLSGNSLIIANRTRVIIAIVFLLLSLVSLYLFSAFRYKSTIRAYELVITHYYLQSPPQVSTGVSTVRSSVIKSEMQPSFVNKHRRLLDYLFKGISNQVMQVTINTGELQNTFFNNEKNEWWYCIQGKGIMTIRDGPGETFYFLQPTVILPISKGSKYSFNNKQKEPLELIVLNQ